MVYNKTGVKYSISNRFLTKKDELKFNLELYISLLTCIRQLDSSGQNIYKGHWTNITLELASAHWTNITLELASTNWTNITLELASTHWTNITLESTTFRVFSKLHHTIEC